MADPIQLVKVDGDVLEVCEEGLRVLSALEGKIGVIAISGPKGTGKSFLMTLLGGSVSSGFEVGETTEGVWIYHNSTSAKDIVLLDFQGASKSRVLDEKLFALGALLSSVFIYNTRGMIDELAIRDLALTDLLLTAQDEELSKFVAKRFFWVLRDFSVKLLDDDGQLMTAKEYMENVLAMKPKYSKQQQSYLKYRDIVLRLFNNRQCVTLCKPIKSKEELHSMNARYMNILHPSFLENFTVLNREVIVNCATKKVQGRRVTGHTLGVFLLGLVSSFNNGDALQLDIVWGHALAAHCQNAYSQAKRHFKQCTGEILLTLPREESELYQSLEQIKSQSLHRTALYNREQEEEFTLKFQNYYERALDGLMETNKTASAAYNSTLISKLFKSAINKGRENEGNVQLLETEWNQALRQYELQAKGPAKFRAIAQLTKEYQHAMYSKAFSQLIEHYEDEYQQVQDDQQGLKLQRLLKERAKDDAEDIELLLEEHLEFLKNQCQLESGSADVNELLALYEAEIFSKLQPAPTPVPPPQSPSKSCCVAF